VNCGDCHQHTGNFEGEGDCTACHNSARGIRPEIVSQFNRATSHVTPTVGSVTEEDCLVCHDQSTHQEQTVRINDPDDIAASFSQPTAGAPTLDPGQGSAFEQACLNCHDADGATRLTGNTGAQTPLSPFTDAPDPFVFDSGTWAQSGHGASSVVTCLGDGTGGGCHGSGHGSANNALLAPAATEIIDDHITDLCAGCHDADGPSTFDIAGEFDWPTILRETAGRPPIRAP
jgi:predicted CXXCH cytochrome family protein